MAKSVVKIIEETCSEICDNICKWRDDERYQGENADMLYEEKCDTCPMNRFLE